MPNGVTMLVDKGRQPHGVTPGFLVRAAKTPKVAKLRAISSPHVN